MPMYDRECQSCLKITLDHYEPITFDTLVVCECGGPTHRVFTSKANGVIGDDIPGGYWVRHGICNEDGSPKKYYSKSDMIKAAKEKGVMNVVEHVPERGSDKSKHTTRWI